MANLGRKYSCYSCHTKFYDLGKPLPVCPKCGADQRDAEESPVTTSTRSRKAVVIVEEPIEEPEFDSEAEPVVADEAEDEELVVESEPEEEVEGEEEDY